MRCETCKGTRWSIRVEIKKFDGIDTIYHVPLPCPDCLGGETHCCGGDQACEWPDNAMDDFG